MAYAHHLLYEIVCGHVTYDAEYILCFGCIEINRYKSEMYAGDMALIAPRVGNTSSSDSMVFFQPNIHSESDLSGPFSESDVVKIFINILAPSFGGFNIQWFSRDIVVSFVVEISKISFLSYTQGY